MSSVDEPPAPPARRAAAAAAAPLAAPPPPARLDADAFFLAVSASSAARRAFFFSSSSALVPSVLPWPLNFCVEFCGCSVGGETAVSAMGTSGRSDGTFASSSQLISCGAKSPDPAGSGAHLAEDGLVHLLTVHIEAGTKTRVETLACRVGGDEDAGGNPAACLARGLSGDGRRSLLNSPQFDCSAPCFHFITCTQRRVRYAVPRRDPRGGARRGRVPVRAIRARARVRDVAGEPALHPPCVSRPHEPTPARFDVFNPKRRVLVGSTHLPRVFRS